MEFTFVSRQPGPPLDRFVESLWYAHGQIDYPRERIAPTGSTVVVIVLGDPIREVPDDGHGEPFVATTGFLLGPHDRPVVNEPTGGTHCVGVVSTAIGCEPLFGVQPAPLSGRAIDLKRAWRRAIRLRRDLLRASGVDAMLDLVERELTADLEPGGGAVERCERAVRVLEADSATSIADVAATVGVSHGHLDREFIKVVGLSPRAISRIYRLRALLAEVNVFGPTDWATLATRYGWFDQSHFIRDFKRHTGVTPTQYAIAQRVSFTVAEAAPGFVPQR